MTSISHAGLDVHEFLEQKIKKNAGDQESMGSECWALIFAVGVYKNRPDKDRPSMLEAADNLYNVLLDSPQWQHDHIHKVTGSQATGEALIRELIWLIQNEDEDDLSVIFLTTHGSPLINSKGLPVDLPPKDETDGADEILVMYEGFDKWYAFIWDDLLNFFLSLLESEGVCLIVDSCYSGGFNDYPFTGMHSEYTAVSFTEGFGREIATQGRVVLMSTQENTPSWGSIFTEYIISAIGFWNWADIFGNNDGINSAQEAFAFAKPLVEFETGGDQVPTIFDLYQKEFPLTYT
jgi:hypothetical protein